MAVQTTLVNKPFSPRGNDQSPLAYNRAKLFSGKALDFDGVNDYVDLNGFTMSGDKGTFCFYADIDNDAYVFDFLGQRFIMVHNETSGQGIRVFNNNAWTNYGNIGRVGVLFYAIVCDGTNQSVYVNGQQHGNTQSVAALDLSASTKGKLMSNYNGDGTFCNGAMSGFKIFNTALTAAQVADLYNNPEKVVPTGVDNTALKLWLPMQEGAGTAAYDGSGNGNHGTISGATYVHGIGAPVSQTAVIDWNKGVNKITYSEDFSQSVWSKTQVNIESGYTAPDGSATAYKVTYDDTAANLFGFTNQALGTYKSIWAKTTSGTGTTSLMNRYNEPSSVFTITNEWQRFDVAHSGGDFFYAVDMRGGGLTEVILWGAQMIDGSTLTPYIPTHGTAQTSPVLLPQGLTSGRDITGVNLFENVRKQGALNLDGNSWAEVHDNGSLDFGTGSFTFEAWAKYSYVSQGSSLNAIISLGGDIGQGGGHGRAGLVSSSSGSSMSFFYDSTGNASTSSFSEGDWVHFVGVYDETNAIVYINGAEERTTARTAASMTNADAKQIGRDSTEIRYYNDQIAQPRIYNRALTAEEVQRNYNAGKNIYTN